jgi:hypothetical protein
MTLGSQVNYPPEGQATVSGSKTEEVIGHIRENGMRYAGRMPNGTEVIHTPIDYKAQSTVMSFNEAAKKVKSEKICGYPAGTLAFASQDQLDVIRLSYTQEERNAIGPVWSRQRIDGSADLQSFGSGYRGWDGRVDLAHVCLVPKQQP